MEESLVKTKSASQWFIWWGWFLMIVPIIGIVIIFFWWTFLNLIGNVLSWGVEINSNDQLGTILTFIKWLLTMAGLLCTFWGLSLSPVGLILLIVGLVKKNEKK